MNEVLVLTQGKLGEELVSAARKIVGDLPHITAVSLPWDATLEDCLDRLSAALAVLDSTTTVLIVTDMFGGTPYNVAMRFFEPGRVEVVSGANLPMVVKLGCPGEAERTIQELALWITTKARLSISSSSSDNCAADDLGKNSSSVALRTDGCDG